MFSLRVARKEDAESILSIYTPFLEDTNTTFDYEVEEASAFTQRIENLLVEFPWLIVEVDGKAVGYAYAKKHRERTAYQWSAESTVYVQEEYQGNGLARAVYEALLEILTEQKYVNIYSGIAQPNESSTMFHVKMGYTPVGVYKKVGYKNGQWYDVVWLHRTLIKHPENPEPIIKFSDPVIQAKVGQILASKQGITEG
jgi:L-amino acid N-acyltransferase YncA